MSNVVCYWLFCFVPVTEGASTKIFGFSEFLTAVALLAVVYTITDVRYKFRIAVASDSLYAITFFLIALIGVQTLLTEVWIAENWWVLKTVGLTRSIWQAIFGILFLGTFLTWMYYAFIRPPIFGPGNACRFAQELYQYILRGNDDDLKIIAQEIARSAKSLIEHSRRLPPRNQNKSISSVNLKMQATVDGYAHDILLLIANRKFCQQIVSASPVTAQLFFESMSSIRKFDIPMEQFARNISSEAIAQKDSFLYVEAEGYESGLLGYLKPVSQAVFGNYELVEALARSPLDLHFEEQERWNARQWEAYCRATLIVLEDFLRKSGNSQHSFSLYRAFENVKSMYRDLHKLSDHTDMLASDIYARLRVAVEFVEGAINLVDKQTVPPIPLFRIRGKTFPKNIYDHLASLIFDMCFAASVLKSPPEICWIVHHNMVWGTFFGLGNSNGYAWRIVRHKVRRLLYDEIARLSGFPNYKGSRILGFCLHVLGLHTGPNKQQYGRDSYALANAVHSWTRKGYLLMRHENPDVADSVLIGSLTFDERGNRLVKTYFKGLNREAPKSYLELDLKDFVTARSLRVRKCSRARGR